MELLDYKDKCINFKYQVQSQSERLTLPKICRFYALKNFRYFFLAVVFLAITASMQSLVPFISGLLIDAIGEKDLGKFTRLCSLFIYIAIINSIFAFLRAWVIENISENVLKTIRIEFFKVLVSKDIEFYERNPSGQLTSRYSSDLTVLKSAISDNLSLLLRNSIQFLISLVFLFYLSTGLLMYILSLVVPIILVMMIFMRIYKKLSKKYQDEIALDSTTVGEILANIKITKAFSAEEREISRVGSSIDKVFRIGARRALFYGVFLGIITILAYGIILFVLYKGGKLVLEGFLTIGELSSFIIYTTTLSISMMSMSSTMNQIASAKGIAEKLLDIINEPTNIPNNSNELIESGIDSNDYNNLISLRDVTFSYPSKPASIVINKVSLDIPKGGKVAIVGASGSGKSTLLNLLMRFYDVQAGNLKLGNRNIDDIDLNELRRSMGYVPQDPILFSGTILDNILYGVKDKSKVDQEAIDRAIRNAHLEEVIENKESFPNSLMTSVGERGSSLSGGQRQRVSIARALIADTPILLLDEATSMLDSQKESQVHEAIEGIVSESNKTIIIVAHRLSTIVNCDRLFVLKEGSLVEQGNHHELMAKRGEYYRLFRSQLSN